MGTTARVRLAASVLAVALLVTVPGLPRLDAAVGFLSSSATGGGHDPPLAPAPAAAGSVPTVLGVVRAPDEAPVANVTVWLGSNCTLPATPAGCVLENRTTTNESGGYAFSNLTSAPNYWVWSNRTGTMAGASRHVGPLRVPTNYANLTLARYEAVDTRDFVLPNWTNLSSYAANSNCDARQGACASGSHPAGQQVPILAWSQDGVFYVNATDELVFDSFANGTVRGIANWTPLFQNLMSYTGIENTEWITQDSQYVYTFGRPTVSSTAVEAYWANVTTGAVGWHVFTEVATPKLYNNTQLQMIGEDGNSSIVAVVAQDGIVYAYNLWNRTEWTLGTLPFFEANNVYWVPALDSFLDIEAGGDSSDRVWQLRLEGPGAGSTLVPVFRGTYAHAYVSNGVNGLVFNVTARTVAFTYLDTSPTYATTEFQVLANGTLGRQLANWTGGIPGNRGDGSPLPYSVMSSEHRIGVYSWGANYAAYTDANFENGSFTDVPVPSGGWVGTNITYGHPAQYKLKNGNGSSNYYPSVDLIENSAVEGMSFDATFGLVEGSVDCRTNGSVCGLDGNAYGANLSGTVQYYWPNGTPELPYGPGVPLAELAPPSNVTNVSLTPSVDTMAVDWAPPVDGANPIVNYTVDWGPSPLLGNTVNVPAENATSLVLAGLASSTTYYVVIRATNLHGTNVGFLAHGTTLQRGPAAPSYLGVAAASFDWVALNWTNPGGTLTDNHVYWQPGTNCASPSGVDLGGVATSYTVYGLAGATVYCFQVSASSSTGEGPRTGFLVVATEADPVPAAPTGLNATAVGPSSAHLSWDLPPGGGLLNETIAVSTDCVGRPLNVSTHGVVTSYNLTSLAAGVPYCFSVRAWNASGPGPSSPMAGLTIPAVADPPSGLAASNVTATLAELVWHETNESSVLNDTIDWGANCELDQEASLGHAAESARLVGLTPGTSYCWEVRAWNEIGPSPESAVSEFTTLVNVSTVDFVPQGLWVSAVAPTEISIRWVDPPLPIDHVVVLVGPQCLGTDPGRLVAGAATGEVVAGLTPATPYCLGVQLWNGTTASPVEYLNATTAAAPASAPSGSLPWATWLSWGLRGLDAAALVGAAVAAVLLFHGWRRGRARSSGRPRGPPR